MSEICPLCESGWRLMERKAGVRVVESCECAAGQENVRKIQTQRRRRLGGMDGRRQQLLERFGSEEGIPQEQLQPGELLRWFMEDYGSFHEIPEEKKALLERKPVARPFDPEAFAKLKAKSPPPLERKQQRKPVPYVEGIARMHGKIHGLD